MDNLILMCLFCVFVVWFTDDGADILAKKIVKVMEWFKK